MIKTFFLIIFVLFLNMNLSLRASVYLINFQLQKVELHFEGEKYTRDRKIESAISNGINSQGKFREEIHMTTLGNIYHPDLFKFSLMTNVGLIQSSLPEDNSNPDKLDKGTLTDLVFQGNLLRKKMVNLTAYYNRRFQHLNRIIFNDALLNERGWGVALYLRHNAYPLTLEYSENNSKENFRNRFIYLDENRLSLQLNVRPVEYVRSRLSVVHTIADRTEVGLYQQNITNTTINYNNIIRTSDNSKQLCRYNFYFNLIDRGEPVKTFRMGLEYRINYKKFDWFGRQTYSEYEATALSSSNNQLEIGFTHQLYNSLQTDFQVFHKLDTQTGGHQNIKGMHLELIYRKLLPYGKLVGDFGVHPNWDISSSETGAINRIKLRHQFSLQNPFAIPYQNVIEESIFITSEDGLHEYVKEADYRIIAAGDLFQLLRLPGSMMPDSQVVLIQFDQIRDQDIEAYYIYMNYSLTYRIQSSYMLNFGYSGNRSRYDTQNVNMWWTFDEKTVHTLFLRFNRSQFTFDCDWKTSSSSIIPFTTASVSARNVFGSYISHYLILGVRASRMQYPLNQDVIWQQMYNAEYFRRVGRHFKFKVSWTRQITKGKFNDLKDTGIDLIAKYDTRKLICIATVEYTTINFFDEYQTDLQYSFKVNMRIW